MALLSFGEVVVKDLEVLRWICAGGEQVTGLPACRGVDGPAQKLCGGV